MATNAVDSINVVMSIIENDSGTTGNPADFQAVNPPIKLKTFVKLWDSRVAAAVGLVPPS